MSDLINRQAAINEIDEWIEAFRENGHKESAADACLIQDGIIQLPSAEPERKKGQWIWCTSSDHLKCSECGTRAPMYMDYVDGDYQEWLSDFCPECGCEMKGFEEDE